MNNKKLYIFTGRFQPLHNGHISFVNKFFEMFPDEKLIIGIIRNINNLEWNDDFGRYSTSIFEDKSNPFSSYTTLEMVTNDIVLQFPQKVTTTILPRPARGVTWDVISSILSGQRVWLIPEIKGALGEWEEKKALFYESQGDEVIRINISKTISANQIRKIIQDKDIGSVKKMVPEYVYSILLKQNAI